TNRFSTRRVFSISASPRKRSATNPARAPRTARSTNAGETRSPRASRPTRRSVTSHPWDADLPRGPARASGEHPGYHRKWRFLPMTVALSEGAVFANRYKIVRCIAAGGMGAVYEVIHLETERKRALKVMLPHILGSQELRDRFKREARVAAQIESEFIV